LQKSRWFSHKISLTVKITNAALNVRDGYFNAVSSYATAKVRTIRRVKKII